jgi:hypothetical protein
VRWEVISRPVSGQRLRKHAPASTVTHVTGVTGCFLRDPLREVIKKRTGATKSVDNLQLFFTGLEHEIRLIAVLETVTKKHLVKTLKAGKDFVFAAVICKIWK